MQRRKEFLAADLRTAEMTVGSWIGNAVGIYNFKNTQ